jgi:hypothetical protein
MLNDNAISMDTCREGKDKRDVPILAVRYTSWTLDPIGRKPALNLRRMVRVHDEKGKRQHTEYSTLKILLGRVLHSPSLPAGIVRLAQAQCSPMS